MHELYYPIALSEIKDGYRKKHWMWYIFSQLKGLGHSSNYGLSCVGKVEEYMSNEYLRNNTLEICNKL